FGRHPLPWVIQGKEIRVKRLGVGPILGLAGACFLLWVPRLISDSKTDLLRAVALPNIPVNFVGINRRLPIIHQAIEAIGTKNAGDELRSLPDRLVAIGSFELSFCRSLESHVTHVDPEFLRYASAYCYVASNFTETESHRWGAFKQAKGAQSLF